MRVESHVAVPFLGTCGSILVLMKSNAPAGSSSISTDWSCIKASAFSVIITVGFIWQTTPDLPAEQVFDRRNAVKLYRIFVAEHGVVNLDA